MSETGATRFDDVRMRGFHRRASVDAVLALVSERLAALAAEPVPVVAAAGRVLAEPVVAGADVPPFPKSAMDGYAVRAADTVAPTHLQVIGEALPARPFAGAVVPGTAVRIATGAPVPDGSDAILMAEFADRDSNGRVSARAPVPTGKNVVRTGEDVPKGRAVLPAGRVLRAQDIGLLAALGAATVSVVRRPRAAVVVTGNELLRPGAAPDGFHTPDSNSPMLAALAARDGATVEPPRYAADTFEHVCGLLRDAAATADVILISGGTSVGPEDHVPRAVAELGELAVHGVALRPAGPTGVGFVGGAVAFLLPGNPSSCLCAYDLFAGRAVRRLGGRSWEFPYQKESRVLGAAVPSAAGRTDYVRVVRSGAGVVPVPGGGASLSATVAADGFILVPPDREALAPGEVVDVWLFE